MEWLAIYSLLGINIMLIRFLCIFSSRCRGFIFYARINIQLEPPYWHGRDWHHTNRQAVSCYICMFVETIIININYKACVCSQLSTLFDWLILSTSCLGILRLLSSKISVFMKSLTSFQIEIWAGSCGEPETRRREAYSSVRTRGKRHQKIDGGH